MGMGNIGFQFSQQAACMPAGEPVADQNNLYAGTDTICIGIGTGFGRSATQYQCNIVISGLFVGQLDDVTFAAGKPAR